MANLEDEVERMFNEYVDSIKKRVEKVVTERVDNAKKEFVRIVSNDMKIKYEELARDFYDDYDPIYYGRHESLLDEGNYKIVYADDGLSSDLVIDKSGLTQFRKGGSIYDLVVREGYHGGAKFGDYTHYDHYGNNRNGVDVYTPHPNPGVPYWRTPYGVYSRWGHQAEKSTSMVDRWNTWMNSYEVDAQKLYDKLIADSIKDVNKYLE